MHRRVTLVAAVVLLVSGAYAGPASAASANLIPRPPTGGENAYEQPSQTFSGERVVVHWVSRGPAAPMLNDDDVDGVPDYVEQVASAADAALRFFEQRGFRAPVPDEGGLDARPDIYIAELPFGVFGYMAPTSASWDGAFVVVSAHLDAREPLALGSLRITVGHELFHVVQQAYLDDLHPWVAEGTADALASLAAPEAHDFADELRQTRWASKASGSMADNDPYAASAFWRFVENRDPGYIAALLERRARMPLRAQEADPSWYRTLESVYRSRGQGSIDEAFVRFARGLVVERVLGAGGAIRPGKRQVTPCSPLSIRVFRLVIPARARTVEVTLTGLGHARAQLLLGTRTVLVRATRSSGRITVRLRGGEQPNARLVVTGAALADTDDAVSVRLATT